MEGIEEGAVHKVLGPDHARRLDQKCAAETRKAKASEDGGEGEEDLEHRAKIDAVILSSDNDGIHNTAWDGANVGHHVDEDMLLDIEGPWVQANFAATKNLGEEPGADGEGECKCLAERVCNEEDEGR